MADNERESSVAAGRRLHEQMHRADSAARRSEGSLQTGRDLYDRMHPKKETMK